MYGSRSINSKKPSQKPKKSPLTNDDDVAELLVI